ncbi:hypothetical protein [Oceanicella sp. SM1341]|uniref:acyltransferase n=1 Tax=Oceanicella sp. SM1341 TaxID=1548889 RepID=UPI00130040DB|nr:hypothetical protein [Oceanicella sp. SM1341]
MPSDLTASLCAGLPSPIGDDGFALPETEGLVFHEQPAEGAGPAVLRPGLRATVDRGHDNLVFAHPGTLKHSCSIMVRNGSENRILLGKTRVVKGQITINGSRNRIILCGGGPEDRPAGAFTLNATIVADDATLFIGRDTTVGGVNIWVQGDRSAMVIGEDCMISWDVKLRTGDAHSVIDMASERVTNLVRDVTVGPHVWLGYEVHVFKGVNIGAGSIIGSTSTVIRDVAPCSAASGVPARTLRSGVTWSRQMQAGPEEIRRILGRSYLRAHRPEAVSAETD